jgi:hypothetical protein
VAASGAWNHVARTVIGLGPRAELPKESMTAHEAAGVAYSSRACVVAAGGTINYSNNQPPKLSGSGIS